jgi:hypothetical protein
MNPSEELEAQVKDFASEIQEANKALSERLPAVKGIASQYNQAAQTDREKINVGKFSNLLDRLGELVQEMDAACERVTGKNLI